MTIAAKEKPRLRRIYRVSAIASASSKLEQPRRIIDQDFLLQFGLRCKQRNQVDEVAVIGHHLHIGMRPIGSPYHAVRRSLDDAARERHRVVERWPAG